MAVSFEEFLCAVLALSVVWRQMGGEDLGSVTLIVKDVRKDGVYVSLKPPLSTVNMDT